MINYNHKIIYKYINLKSDKEFFYIQYYQDDYIIATEVNSYIEDINSSDIITVYYLHNQSYNVNLYCFIKKSYILFEMRSLESSKEAILTSCLYPTTDSISSIIDFTDISELKSLFINFMHHEKLQPFLTLALLQ